MKLALGQINTIVGDLVGNQAKILATYERGVAAGMDLVVLPELAITGYPPRDLLFRESFVTSNLKVLTQLAQATGKTGLVVGYVGHNETQTGRNITNSVALLQHGRIIATRHKTLLPTYDVFDEARYFEPATDNLPVEFNGVSIGLTVCEDIWNDADFWPNRLYPCDPVRNLIAAGVKLIINVSASPWSLGKTKLRRDMLAAIAGKGQCSIVYCNLVGGNDELVFDGASLVLNDQGAIVAEGKPFEEDFVTLDLAQAPALMPQTLPDEEEVFKALVLGLRDYTHKCGFKFALLGLSGGIDSALTAVIAVSALGKENVRGISLPSQFSSQGSLDDARILAENLGIQYDVIPIQPLFQTTKEQLKTVFAGKPEDVTEENIQARLRGVILMGMSNKFGSLLLTTGNKSEVAVGYCTLYGDMCGGLAVINDVPKMMVYRISHWINREREVIPSASITKPPSAELRPDQKDQDSLPPYEILDAILDQYVVQCRPVEDIIKSGFDAAVVQRVVRLIDNSEYKRRQSAPGIKVTSKAFGVGRRVPVAQRYREI
ncbi:MAG TPA: NAD+ synthase [Verrucomicrobiae bacterium]|jgi:NAD+ synthetase